MFQPRFHLLRARHPLARVLAAICGAVAVALVLALGVLALAALAVGGGLWLLVNALRRPAAQPAGARPAAPASTTPGVIEGDFTVLPVRPPR